jgi:hypothetical protein
MSVIGGAGAAVCGLCGVAVPGSNVVEKYACTIGCCVLGMFVLRDRMLLIRRDSMIDA